MEDFSVIGCINNARSWIIRNQEFLLSYIINSISAITIISIGIIGSRIVSKTVNRIMLIHQIDVTVKDFLSGLVRHGVMILTIVTALGCIGVQTTSIVAVLGATGLAIGLALQGSLANLAAGILLVVFRPFRSGEYVYLCGIEGTVISIQILSTTLLMPDGKTVIVPNGKIISGNIINYSREPVRRNEWIVSISYDSDIDKVKELIIDIINSEDRILKDKEITIRLNEIDSDAINFLIRAWSRNSDLKIVYWNVLERIKRNFDANRINFAHSRKRI